MVFFYIINESECLITCNGENIKGNVLERIKNYACLLYIKNICILKIYIFLYI